MGLDMIKAWKILGIINNPDQTKTILYSISKSSVVVNELKQPTGYETNKYSGSYVVPQDYTEADIDRALFRILRNDGWV
jgi:hypothetical protein